MIGDLSGPNIPKGPTPAAFSNLLNVLPALVLERSSNVSDAFLALISNSAKAVAPFIIFKFCNDWASVVLEI